jgi:PleD family two-component response regulator
MNTKIENNEAFDLPTLLKQGDLDIRRFATANPLFTVAQYFYTLSCLSKTEPSVSSALTKFVDCDADRGACRSLENMISLLESLGDDKLILDFHSLLNAYGKKGNWREAAIHAKKVKQSVADFYSHITSAIIKPGNSSSVQNPDGTTLKEYIERLDDEETHRKLQILIVDDSPVILKSVSSVLSDTYKVFALPRPEKIRDVLQKLTPELFLLDYLMPEITGFELIPIIRSYEEHKETPIIFLTSEGTIENVSAALALGACDFIVKPFKPDILREKIAKHIVRKKAF